MYCHVTTSEYTTLVKPFKLKSILLFTECLDRILPSIRPLLSFLGKKTMTGVLYILIIMKL